MRAVATWLCLVTAVCGALQLPTYLYETEKKHARVAMLALPSLVALRAQGVDVPAAWLATQPLDVQIDFFSAAAITEAAFTLPRYNDTSFKLRDDIVPGKFVNTDPSALVDDLETSVGRASMLLTLAWMIRDLVF